MYPPKVYFAWPAWLIEMIEGPPKNAFSNLLAVPLPSNL